MDQLVARHINGLPADVQPIYKRLRKIALEGLPDCAELVYHNSLGYSLSKSPFDRICYIAHQPKGYVNFGFFFGHDLPDPGQLIQGEGKRIRHVKIYSLEQANDPYLLKLVEHARRKAEKDVSIWRASLRKSRSTKK